MSCIKYNLSSILILLLTLGCSVSSYNTSNIEDKTYISKSDISLNAKSSPNKINIFYYDSEPEDFLAGFTLNYFYTKNKTQYNPELLFVNLEKNAELCNKKFKVTRNSYSIIYLKNNDIDFINLDCVYGMVDKSVLVLNLSKNKIFIPKNFSYLNVERKTIIRNILAKGIKEGNLRSIIIDDQNTNDKGDIAKIWKDLGGSVVVQASLEKQSTSQKLFSKILLLEQSENRNRKLSREISLALEHEPRRRKDVDLFIISTNLKTSRSLKPALDYNLANSLPVYLIPEWGEKENLKEKEIDLESSFITGMSLMLNARINPSNLEEIRKSERFAAGYDAFELAVLLNNQKKISYLGMMGLISNKTEKLELTPLIGKIKKGEIEFLHPID
jgi:hypothetical protein